MIELLICKDSEWVGLDVVEQALPVTLQGSDLSNLVDSRATYSQVVTLPISKHNRDVLEWADVFEARSKVPYKVYDCKVYDNGIDYLQEMQLLGISASLGLKLRTYLS